MAGKHIPICGFILLIMIEAVVMNYITALQIPQGFGWIYVSVAVGEPHLLTSFPSSPPLPDSFLLFSPVLPLTFTQPFHNCNCLSHFTTNLYPHYHYLSPQLFFLLLISSHWLPFCHLIYLPAVLPTSSNIYFLWWFSLLALSPDFVFPNPFSHSLSSLHLLLHFPFTPTPPIPPSLSSTSDHQQPRQTTDIISNFHGNQSWKNNMQCSRPSPAEPQLGRITNSWIFTVWNSLCHHCVLCPCREHDEIDRFFQNRFMRKPPVVMPLEDIGTCGA